MKRIRIAVAINALLFLCFSGGHSLGQSDQWSATSMIDAPSPRRTHTAVWTGTEVIIWGGYGDTFDVNTGGRYDPVNDQWRVMTTVDAPTERERHSAAWTGTEMIVWGGSHFGNYFDTGGRYDPLSDSWRATSVVDAPEPRRDHAAVWTGSKMIVWGGYCCSSTTQVVNTGGVYDPISDTWVALPTTNAPPAAGDTVGLWTGTEMIIWGGKSGPGYLNTGGRYNPFTNTWFPMSGIGAPPARSAHVAVWTGTEMIVWGGEGPSGVLSDGGRYDPISDQWAPIATANAPAARSHVYTAVWTGQEMIVWGGAAGGSFLDTGGRYDPDTDTWTPTTMIEAPSARHAEVPVWTGSQVVVWGGGSYNSAYLSTGARYGTTLAAPATYCESVKLLPCNLEAGDGLGSRERVSIHGDLVIAGAVGDDDANPGSSECNSGAAYVLRREVTDWVLEAKLLAPVPTCGKRFGHVTSFDGLRLLVGTIGFSQDEFGEVYVFRRENQTWIYETELVTSVIETGSRYGWAVSIDGDWAVVGAEGENDGNGSGPNIFTGAAYAFHRDHVSGQWASIAERLTAPTGDQGSADYFGYSVAVNGDWLAIGANRDDGISGSVYMFHRASNAWLLAQPKLKSFGTPSPLTDNVYFGESVAMQNGTLAVGAPFYGDFFRAGATYVFRLSGSTWIPEVRLTADNATQGDEFGTIVAIDGQRIVSSAFVDDQGGANAGSAYVHRRLAGGAWIQEANLLPSDIAAADLFSYGIGISGDLVAAGASGNDQAGLNAGAAYVFDLTGVRCSDSPICCTEPEVCNGVDDDCDGGVDEGFEAFLEVCNGADDNCNGLIDEGDPEGGSPCVTGQPGVCASGTLYCDAGSLLCIADQGPSCEICGNGLDDDCDGTIDETTDDIDGDGIANCDDNCCDAYNPTQLNQDADAFGDVCDCDPTPTEVGSTVTVQQGAVGDCDDDPATPDVPCTEIRWTAVPGIDEYHAYRGYFTVGNDFEYNHQCLSSNVFGTTTTEPFEPRRATFFYYLITSKCPVGESESDLGTDSAGTPRPQPFVCPDPTMDLDGDGTFEALDNCPGAVNETQSNVDSDAHGDICDNCPPDVNDDQANLDADALGDVCDPDVDGDTILDDGDGSGTAGDGRCTEGNTLACDDNCPRNANPGQEDTDTNGGPDGVGDACDNCANDSNPGQEDSDDDGLGDACDPSP